MQPFWIILSCCIFDMWYMFTSGNYFTFCHAHFSGNLLLFKFSMNNKGIIHVLWHRLLANHDILGGKVAWTVSWWIEQVYLVHFTIMTVL